MRLFGSLTFALAASIALAGSPARAATCQTESTTCPTTMPVGGYCECKSGGNTQTGSVVDKAEAPRGGASGATAGGCGANPNAPGCR